MVSLSSEQQSPHQDTTFIRPALLTALRLEVLLLQAVKHLQHVADPVLLLQGDEGEEEGVGDVL